MPGARAVAGRARAEDLLVQLAAWRLRPLHRARLDDGDRPGAGGPRPVAVDQRRRAGAVGGEQLQLLRAAHRGDRRGVRRRPRHALGGARPRGTRRVPARHRRRGGQHHLPQPLRAPALLRDPLRGHHRQPRTPLPRDRLRVLAGEDRGVHVAAPVPGLRRRAAAAGVARGAGRRDADRGLHGALGAARARVAGGGRALGDRPSRRAPDPARDLRAPAVPGERRHRLPLDEPGGRDPLGRRGAEDPAGDPDRQLARGRALHPRRALDRPAPARQLEADRDARAPARPRQHRDRRRARRADDARGGSPRRPRPGRGRARRRDRRAGHGGRGESA